MILTNLSNYRDNFFSVIIIGSGPAGISTALRLEKYKIKTLIIEAGSLEDSQNKEDFFKGNIFGDVDPNENLSLKRARMFGGTSSLWGGHCSKFEKEQFENWPIDYEECYKLENDTNKILGLKNYHTDFYYKKFSENFNQFHRRYASKKRFKDIYYDYIKNSKYIYLSLNTSLIKFKGSQNQIKSIECRLKDKNYQIKSKHYILAAGGIENSRLLLWSKRNNGELFNNSLPIGKYFMDHPWHPPAEGFINYNKLLEYYKNNNISREFYIDCLSRIYLSPSKEFKNKNQILSAALWLRFENKNNFNSNKNFFKKAYCVAPNFFKNHFEKDKTDELFKFSVSLHQEQEPLPSNKISLDKNSDPFGIPYAYLNWKISDKLKKTAQDNLVSLGKFLIKQNLGRISIDEYIFEEKFDYIFGGAHPMGGTRMGKNSKTSVVDSNLKVHSINNLFITGSSVFPTSGHGHPTYTIVSLSLRLGDHIKKILT